MGCGCSSNFSGKKKESSNVWNKASGDKDNSVSVPLTKCYICPDETIMGESYIDNKGNTRQDYISGCEFNSDGSVFMIKNGNIGYGANSYFAQNGCPTEGWNSNGIYVTTNAPSSSNTSSSQGITLGGSNRRQKPQKGKRASQKCDCRKGGNCQCSKSNDSGSKSMTRESLDNKYNTFMSFVGDSNKKTLESSRGSNSFLKRGDLGMEF